jgi:hypothetical protein
LVAVPSAWTLWALVAFIALGSGWALWA